MSIVMKKQILEKKWEYNETVHNRFVDFRKAYDSLRREVLYNETSQEVIMYQQNDGNAEVLQAAKLCFCKRNRSLFRSMFPDISKKKLNDVLLAAWDSSTETERNIYMSEVLRTSSPVINPLLVRLLAPSVSSISKVDINNEDDSVGTQPAIVSQPLQSAEEVPLANLVNDMLEASNEEIHAQLPLLGGFSSDLLDEYSSSLESVGEKELELGFPDHAEFETIDFSEFFYYLVDNNASV